MKKLYRKSTVHPSPPPPSQQPPSTDHLAFLPAAILTLAAVLTATDREVLAYLLSCSSASSPASAGIISKQGPNKKEVKGGGGGSHQVAFTCDCFSCYMSYWARWDSSPNRQLIHEIIDAYEDWVPAKNRGGSGKNRGGRRERKKKGVNGCDSPGVDRISDTGFEQSELGMPEPADHGGSCAGEGKGSGGGSEEEVGEKGPVRKLVSFIGERVWSFWG